MMEVRKVLGSSDYRDGALDGVKYVLLDIGKPDFGVIDYFLRYGENYLYSYCYGDSSGYVYVDYETFKKGQESILKIVLGIDSNYSDLYKARYLYTRLGKIVGKNIDCMSPYAVVYQFDKTLECSNIWGAISSTYVNDVSLSKLYLYLCSLVGVTCSLVERDGRFFNKIILGNREVLVDLYQDLYCIQGGLETKWFGDYNHNIEMDRKIGYIRDNYSDFYIQDYIQSHSSLVADEVFLGDFLLYTQKVLGISSFSSFEIFEVYQNLFLRYCSNFNFGVDNLFVKMDDGSREHLVVISGGEECYCYNYVDGSFVLILKEQLDSYFNDGKIGRYNQESIGNLGMEVLV